VTGRVAAVAAWTLLAGIPSSAHRVDEYLQATTIQIAGDRVRVAMRLTPGVARFPGVLADVDGDADGVLSEPEQRAYAERVRRDLSLTIDGARVPLRLVSSNADPVQDLREGRGVLQIEWDAEVPRGGRRRRLELGNRHQPGTSVYLVNCEVPSDPDVRIIAQKRNGSQSSYRLDYTVGGK
jgi:hypothetical protein